MRFVPAVLGRRGRLGRLRLLPLLRSFFLRGRRSQSESTLNQKLSGYGRSGRRIP